MAITAPKTSFQNYKKAEVIKYPLGTITILLGMNSKQRGRLTQKTNSILDQKTKPKSW